MLTAHVVCSVNLAAASDDLKPLRTFSCSVCGVARLVKGGTSGFRCEDHKPTDPTGKIRAAGEVARAIREGFLAHPLGLKCVDCQKPAIEYDHRDYNKPLKVDPVCRRCNSVRGPAIPRKGFFTEIFEAGFGFYANRSSMEKLFKVIGIDADLSRLPARTTFDDWLLFRDQLIAWESGVLDHLPVQGDWFAAGRRLR
jgi:hypothetical protein